MTGKDFEREVLKLLKARGFIAEITGDAADGGIDILARRTDPLLTGKYIVQCKDWTDPVGEPIVRDLYGVVMAERANKGILVTTSRFTESAKRFAKGKPLELIDGDEWKDLRPKIQDIRESGLAEETGRVFGLVEGFTKGIKKYLADLDAVRDYSFVCPVHRNELDEPYQSFLVHTIRDVLKNIQDQSDHLERWIEFIQATDWNIPHEEAAYDFMHYIERWEYLLETLLSIYRNLHTISPPHTLRNAHSLALQGIHHLASSRAFLLWKCEKQYDEIKDKVTLVIEAEQELSDYHLDKGASLLERAAKELKTLRQKS